MALKTLDQAEIKDKKVVARFDFNVPLKDGAIVDATRIERALPTIKHLLSEGAKTIVLMSHLGRPKGSTVKELSLEPVANYLADKLNEEVILSESCVDRGIKTLLTLPQTKIILLENLRFHKEETQNSSDFAATLASYGELYINDAFGTCHRKHASTYGINQYFKNKAYAGFLLESEVKALSKVVENPAKPFVAIVGGAKVSDKIKVIDSLLTEVKTLIIGGAMAYPFLKAKGYSVGKSMCSDEDVSLAKKILAQKSASKIKLPLDHMVSTEFNGAAKLCSSVDIEEDDMGLDIGPQTIESFSHAIREAKTILWNGPMGVFESQDFSQGTFSIARTLSELPHAFTLVGGGDSVNAVNKSGVAEKMSHVSTGGGASLEYIEQGSLPGIQALKFGL